VIRWADQVPAREKYKTIPFTFDVKGHPAENPRREFVKEKVNKRSTSTVEADHPAEQA
jgi:hypothetical protein